LKKTHQPELAETTLNISIVRKIEDEDNRTDSAKPVNLHSEVHQSTVPFQFSMSVPPAPLPWPDAPIGGDTRPFEPADADRHPSIAALDETTTAGCSRGFADPFHYDWPNW
jgi:hypothetical protein